MGGKDPSRQTLLKHLRRTPAGYVRMAACAKCNHKGPIPVEALIRKHGEELLAEFALLNVTCAECGNKGAKAVMLKLCEPGCSRQRG